MGAKFNKTLSDVVLGRAGPQGSMLGSTYKDVDSELGRIASRYGKSQMASEQEYGDAVKQLQSLLNQQMRRTNPQVAQTLQGIDEGWANLVRVEGAAKAAHNAEGVFTPAQLNAAIRGADDSVRGRAVSRGTALMQDLGNAGQQVLGNKVPNSGTADRLWAGAGTLAAGALQPGIPAALIAGGAAYTRPVQSLLSAAVSARPAAAEPLAGAIARLTGGLSPMAAQTGVEAPRLGRSQEQPRGFANGGIIPDNDIAEQFEYQNRQLQEQNDAWNQEATAISRQAQYDSSAAAEQGAQMGAVSVAQATHTRRENEKLGLESMGEDTQALGYANGGLIGEEEESDAARNASFLSKVASTLKTNGGAFFNSATGQSDNFNNYNLSDVGLAPNAINTSTVSSLMRDSPGIDAGSTVRGLMAESAFGNGRMAKGFKNGGMIGAPEMSGAIRALAFGRSPGGDRPRSGQGKVPRIADMA